MSVVALPIRFGSRRFGKVQNSRLSTDGLEYTQPGCFEYWDGGTTFLVQPPWTDPAIEQYGFKQNALISGGQQDTYGKPIYGWLFADAVNNAVWLIQPDLAGATTTFAGTLSISFEIVRFGVFDGNGERPKTTLVKTLGAWGQSTPDISNADYDTCAEQSITEGDLHLVSAKKDGSVAVLQVSLQTGQEGIGYTYSGVPELRRWPIGYIGVTCTADPDGGVPTLALSVLRDRATTLGTRSALSTSGSLTAGYLCGTSCDYWTGSQTWEQSITDEILALFYQEDETGTEVLTEITVNCLHEGSNSLETPTQSGDDWLQTSTGSMTTTWQLQCNGRTAEWTYQFDETMASAIHCELGMPFTSTWSSDFTESFNGETQTYSSNSYNFSDCYLNYTVATPGTFVFALHGACRSAGDLWHDGYIFETGDYFSWSFIRYAHNVIGLFAWRIPLDKDGTQIRGDAITPDEVIPAASIGTGNYGAYNARTGEAVAGETTTVSYV